MPRYGLLWGSLLNIRELRSLDYIVKFPPEVPMRAIAVLVMLMLVGCASRYRLTEQQEQRVKIMSESQAHAILQAVVMETPESGGLCATNANWIKSRPKVIGFDGSKVRFIDYTAYVKSVDSRVSNFAGSTSVTVDTRYGLDASSFYFDFKDASKVRILAEWVMAPGGQCRHQTTNRALGIYNAKGFFINLDVPSEKLNEVVLAIIKVAPDATMIEGSGL